MKLRFSLSIAMFAVLAVGCGSRFFVAKDKYDSVKKVAVVSYVVNPSILLGTASADDAKWETAAKNVETYAKQMSGNDVVVVPLTEVIGNEKYKAMGKEAVDGYYTAKGMRFLTENSDQLEQAMLTPETAKGLAEALGVDAVVTVYDRWGMSSYAMGFKGRTQNNYTFAMFDKEGNKVWADSVGGTSEEGFPLAGGVIATDMPNFVLNGNQSFEQALTSAKKKLGK